MPTSVQVSQIAPARESLTHRVDLADFIVVPSGSRPDGYHFVHVNVLAGCTDECSCEAGQRGEYCAHRRELDAVEGSYGFARCIHCGALMRLGRLHARSNTVRIWCCPNSPDHSGHEAGVAVLFRMAAGEQPSHAIGSRGSWRLFQ